MENQIAIITDVHGNIEALNTVLKEIDAAGIKEIYHLGDVVGYGHAGAECLRIIREREILSIQGNHDGNISPPRDERMHNDVHAVLERELERLTEEEVEYLKNLPTQRIIDDKIILVHGALTGRDDYIVTTEAVRTNYHKMADEYPNAHICFFGHSHLGMIIGGPQVEMGIHETKTFGLRAESPYLINPGSLGQPRDKCPKTCYCVYNSDEQTITMHRPEYNITAQQEAMKEAGISERLVNRLALGK
jgi:predicted phosphodiesterase